jgi:hypothetical protein
MYRYLFPIMWLGWGVYWWIASRDVKPILRHESVSSRVSHIGPLVLAAILLVAPNLPFPR